MKPNISQLNRSELLALAKDENTLASVLEELATNRQNQEILKEIAKNPNSPPELLLELPRDCLEEIGFNPGLKLILLEDPNFMLKIYRVCFQNYGLDQYQMSIPSWYLKLAYNSQNAELKTFIAANYNTPAEYLEELGLDSDNNIRYKVANSSKISVKLLKKLAKDPVEFIRESVARNPNTLIETLAKLSRDADIDVRIKVARNKKTHLRILENLSLDCHREVRKAVAENPQTSAQILDVLASDRNLEVRETVVYHDNTNIYTLLKLLLITGERKAIILRLFSYLRTKIILSCLRVVGVVILLGSSSPLAQRRKFLELLSKSSSEAVKYLVAQNPNTLPDILAIISQDSDIRVKEEVAKNPNTPAPVLVDLAASTEDKEILRAIAQNPNSPPEL